MNEESKKHKNARIWNLINRDKWNPPVAVKIFVARPQKNTRKSSQDESIKSFPFRFMVEQERKNVIKIAKKGIFN